MEGIEKSEEKENPQNLEWAPENGSRLRPKVKEDSKGIYLIADKH